MAMATLMVFTFSCLSLYFFNIVIKFLNKLWWTPVRIQSLMNSQGVQGPKYRFLYGNTKEMLSMRNGSNSRHPQDLSHNIFPRVQPHSHSWIKLYGMNYLYWFGPRAQLEITETNLIKEVLNNKNGAYDKPDFQDSIKRLAGDGLATVQQGEKWFKMRRLANHAFHGERLKAMIPVMASSVEMTLKKWKQYEDNEIDVFKEFKVLSSEIISRTAFGSSYLEGQRIFDMIMKLVVITARNEYRIRVPIIGKFLKTSDDIEADKLAQGIRDSIVKMMKKREKKTRLDKLDGYGSDFFGLLLKAYHEADQTKKISLDDVINECKTFYLAGQETTASSLTWTIFLLAVHTDWQDKARKEVLELCGQQNPSPDNIAKLKIMNMVVNESLRLYSPGVHIERQVQKESRLGNLTIPENLVISMPLLAPHHDPKIWGEDAHLFRPDRFAEGVAKATNNDIAAFLPFGLGPRSCVGMNFANAETKIALSMILQHFKVTLSPSYVHSPVRLLTMCPQHGLQVLLHPLHT